MAKGSRGPPLQHDSETELRLQVLREEYLDGQSDFIPIAPSDSIVRVESELDAKITVHEQIIMDGLVPDWLMVNCNQDSMFDEG